MRRTITNLTEVAVYLSLEEVLTLIRQGGVIDDLPSDDRGVAVTAEVGDDEIAVSWRAI